MPLYDFECMVDPSYHFERYVPLIAFNNRVLCDCGAFAKRIIRPPIIFSSSSVEYSCPITGAHITTRKEHEENLKRHDCRVLETGEKDFNERRRLEAEARMEREVDRTVERAIDLMPSAKKERLFNEIESGIDLAVERR